MVSVPKKKDLANFLAKGKANSGFNPIVEADNSVGQGFVQRYNGKELRKLFRLAAEDLKTG